MAMFRDVANGVWDRLHLLQAALPDATVYNNMADAMGAEVVEPANDSAGMAPDDMANESDDCYEHGSDGDEDSISDDDTGDGDDGNSKHGVASALRGDDAVVPNGGEEVEAVREDRARRSAGAVRERVERTLKKRVRFLTAGQRCWDWFNQRGFHVTGSVACKVGACARRLAKMERDSGVLMERLAHEFKRMTNGWYGSHRGNRFTKMGTRNEPRIMEWLERRDCVKARLEVGLTENRRHPWLACSANAVAVMDMKRVPASVPCEDRALALPVEVKTFCTPRTIARHQLVADRIASASGGAKWAWCDADDTEALRALIPTQSHRCQVLHQAAVFESKWVLYVAATRRRVLYYVLVRTREPQRRAHVQWLEAVATPMFGWAFQSKARAPAYVPLAEGELMETHHALWWAVRKYVVSFGPLPPVAHLRAALITLYNNAMGAVGTYHCCL